ncbi:MAG TPA: aspartyl protease family protein [Thermoanaerobaculia bacterium]|nr:aspartyl protease family protein [Thermoanaerobaculia bacterium]
MTRNLFLAAFFLTCACATSRTDGIAIPIEVLDDRLPLAQVRINGSRPLTFIVDTGASSGTFVDRALAAELGLSEDSAQAEANPGGEVTVGTVKGATLEIGPLTLTNETLLTAPISQFASLLGRPVDGILGHSFLSRYAVRFDYVGRRLVLDEANRAGVELPLVITRRMPMIDVTLHHHGRRIPARVEIDTGSFEILGLNGSFADATALLAAGDRRLEEKGVAFGGETQGFRARIDSFEVGPFELRGPAVSITTDAGGYESAVQFAGVLGAEALRRFDLIIDYPHDRVFLRPNRRFKDPWIEDLTGLRLSATPPAFRQKKVADVFQGSPAMDAGLRPDDEIVAIDDTPVADLSLVETVRLLRIGDSRMTVLREGKTIELTLRPRPMI